MFTRYLALSGATMVGLLVLVWAYTSAFPAAYMESGYASWAAKAAMLKDCRLGQVAFFGDSRLEAGVVPADLPIPSSNFGLAAGTAIETRVAVDRALACPQPPRQAVLSLAPEHFGPVSNFFWLLSIRYGFLTAGDVLAVQRLAAQVGDSDTLATPTPDGLHGRLRDWLYTSGFPSLSFGSLVQGRVFGRYELNRARFETAMNDRGWAAYSGGNPLHAEHPDRFVVTALQNAEFEGAIAALRARGVETALLIMPYASTHQETDGALSAYRTYLADMAQRGGATLLDPEVPIWPKHLFADGAHLDPVGAHAFTTRLAACLTGDRLNAPCDLSAPKDQAARR